MKLEQTLGQVTQLKNGLTVIYVPFPGLQSAYIYLKGRAGAEAEKTNQIGVAHFLEHLCFAGTEKFPTADAVNKVKEKYGAYANASTMRTTVSYYFKCLTSDMEAGFDFISQITLHPLLQEQDIDKEREIIIQELQAKGLHKTRGFTQGSNNLNYPGKQRIKIPITGRPQHVKRISKKDLVEFMQRTYVANNFYLAVCADSNIETVKALSEKYFGDMHSGKRQVFKPIELNANFGIFVRNKKTRKQASLYIDFWAYAYDDPRRIALSMGAVILRKRLFKYMRISQGFIYDISCTTSAYPSHGGFTIATKTGFGNATTAVRIIKEHIENMKQNGITQEEYETQQKFEETGFVFDAEDPESRAEFYANVYCNDHFAKSHLEIQEIIRNTKIEDINATLLEVFSRNPRISISSKNLAESDVAYAWLGEEADKSS